METSIGCRVRVCSHNREYDPGAGSSNDLKTTVLVVKLDGKALGIVQLVGKGEGLETWRQLKLEYEGKSGNRQAALLRRILNPRAGWEADAREGRSAVESLNRWEKTISRYRTASGEDISDLVVLRGAGCVSTQRRCGDATGPLDSLRCKLNLRALRR